MVIGFVVLQRNTKGVVSLATSVLDTREEAERAIRVNLAAFPTMRFRVVQISPVTNWTGKESARGV